MPSIALNIPNWSTIFMSLPFGMAIHGYPGMRLMTMLIYSTCPLYPRLGAACLAKQVCNNSFLENNSKAVPLVELAKA